MGKIYKKVGGYVPKLYHINNSNGRGIKTKRRPSTNLNRGGNGGGQRVGGGKGRHGGINYLGYYIKNNLIIINLRIGGQPRGGLLLLTTNSQPATLKIIKKHFLTFTNIPVHKLIK